MAVGEFYVEHQNWARFPKVVHVCRKRGYGGIERKRYVPERTCQWHCLDRLDLLDGTSITAYETECGGKQTWWPEGSPNYCPNCGAKVIETSER